ncbi:MAG TPA: asparagine synthase C-terminal domain-containing protein, partial [Acidimicrobiia bacterium]|nr:asparagine synthase C-terminal domain-containing protein [Acidimicrobiia bacterium]
RLEAPGLGGDPLLDAGPEELRTLVRRTLCDAVDRRLIADVPLGAFLSGGIDSSAVVALMARLSPGQVRTFTIGFDDDDVFDERPYAARVARLYNTDHTEFVVNPDKADLIDRLVWHHDQPFGDSSALPTFLLSELTRQHVTVALCGDGGDELFGGYERFAAALGIARLEQGPAWLTGAVASGASRLPDRLLRGPAASAQRALSRLGMGLPDGYLSWISYVPAGWRQRLLRDDDDWAGRDYRRIWDESEGAELLHRLLLLNVDTYLLDDLLPKVDRMAMAHGLEVRSPFLDHELAELALRLPPRRVVRGLSLKRVLRDAVRDLLPADILHRRKHGFGVPLDRWFRTDLAGYVQGQLCSNDSRVNQHLRPDAVRELVAEHQAGAADHGHALWTLLTLEVFLRAQGW